jgi:hypothetical protein
VPDRGGGGGVGVEDVPVIPNVDDVLLQSEPPRRRSLVAKGFLKSSLTCLDSETPGQLEDCT